MASDESVTVTPSSSGLRRVNELFTVRSVSDTAGKLVGEFGDSGTVALSSI